MKKFEESRDAEYFEIFDENIKTLNKKLEESTGVICSLISGKIFQESIQESEVVGDEVNGDKVHGMIEESSAIEPSKSINVMGFSGISQAIRKL